jgi:hypothetical protein
MTTSSLSKSSNGCPTIGEQGGERDPKKSASDQALMRMVWRVCKRAGIRSLSPHQLRHGFANRFLRESGRDVVALQALMGHAHPDTTQQYTDEVKLDELLRRWLAPPRPETHKRRQIWRRLRKELSDELESLRWRRRESNPRPQSPRTERLQA